MEFGANIVPDDTDPASSLGIGLGGVLGHRWLAEDLRIEPEAKLAFVSAGAPSALALLGGLLGMVVITLLLFSHDTFLVNLGAVGTFEVSMYWVLMLTVLLAGLVGTCRLILQAHEPTDLYGGYLVGFVSQFIALRFMF